ncbi:MAG: hypothetical protein FWG47_02010 [Propionibacteriaceae bacterium]|nr:hypothetical protein [Propionibacteriaceae bacterium]
MSTGHDDQAGSGTVLIAAVLLIGCLLAGLAVSAAAYLVKMEQVSQASDLTVLAAAGFGCDAAENVAATHHVEILSCEFAGDAFDHVAIVTVAGEFNLFGFKSQITQTAYGGKLAN